MRNDARFWFDLGLRNALLNDFRPLDLRPDKGGVFENMIISEMHKKILNKKQLTRMYFYREYGGREVDMILESAEKIYQCYEIKLGEKSSVKDFFPLPHALEVIRAGNYADVLLK